MFRLLLPAALLVTGSAALSADRASDERDEARFNAATAGLVAGRPIDCINPHRITTTQRFGNRILFTMTPRQKYLTNTGGGCYGLDRGDAIITRSTENLYCRGDIIRTEDLAARIPSGSCTFGDFTPYSPDGRG